MIQRFKHIITGWARRFKLIKTPVDIQKLSEQRLFHCRFCKYSKKNKIIEFLNGSVLETDALICTKCGCPCLEKTLVKEETCPIKKW